EQLADRLLDLDRQLLGERGALLGDQRRQAAGGLRDRAAKLLAPIAIGLWKRDLTKLPRQQRRLAALVERDSPDRLQGLLVGGAGLGRALHELDDRQARNRCLEPIGPRPLDHARRRGLEEAVAAEQLGDGGPT